MMRNNKFANTGRAARAYDNWLQTDLEEEKAAARETAIEDKAIELYSEILSDPEMMAEALKEIEWDSKYRAFANSLCDTLRAETQNWAYNYIHDLRETSSAMLTDYADTLAADWYEGL